MINELNPGTHKNIRIGTDVRIKVNIVDGEKTVNPINVKHVECYLINTTEESTYFASRFPQEPVSDQYEASAYHVNTCGHPVYFTYPDQHIVPVYQGFGLHPNWSRIYPMHHRANSDAFRAPVFAGEGMGQVVVLFPAEAQKRCGTYKLIIKAKIYQPGYSMIGNLRTITMDYDDVFTLVEDSSQADSDATIVIENEHEIHVEEVKAYGDDDVIIGQSKDITIDVLPTLATDKRIAYYINGTATISNKTDHGYTVTGTSIADPFSGKETTTVTAISVDDPSKSATKTITVHNYCNTVDIKGRDGAIRIPYGKSVVVNPVVFTEDGNFYSSFNIDGQIVTTVSAQITNQGPRPVGVPYHAAEIDINVLDNEANDVVLTNLNSTTTTERCYLQITSKVASEGGIGYLTGKIPVILEPEATEPAGDVYVTNGELDNDGYVNLGRSDNQTVSVDLSNETEWHEGE
jgi:hypothetical protein